MVIAAVVRETPPDDPKSWEYPKIASRSYLHDHHVHGDTRLNAVSTSPVAQAAYGQLIRVVVKIANHPDETWKAHGNFLQVDEEIPAGCLLVEGSLRHNADRVDRHGNFLRLRYGPGTMEDISYERHRAHTGRMDREGRRARRSLRPGTLSPRIREHPDNSPARHAQPGRLSMNRDEHLELARLLFAQNNGDEALKHLGALAGGKLSQDEEPDTARMRLWILAEKDDGDARAMIGSFELLTERHPRLVIPFEKAAPRRCGLSPVE